MQQKMESKDDQRAKSSASTRRLPIGAEVLPDGSAHFRVWAPRCQRVELIITAQSTQQNDGQCVSMQAEDGGYFSIQTGALAVGTRYGFRLDGDPRLFPDPASRFQPDGPEGLSQIVDPSRFLWTDKGWSGIPSAGQVLYEVHIGTFTRAGTWKAAQAELAELARIGITVIEVMPVSDFAGEFGWGYDGVNHFAPTRLYGTPDDFRRFVDHAHQTGLGVILDVVYNHFGPVGNFIPMFSPYFRSEQNSTDWGDAINFDGQHSQGVREYFLANAHYWIDEFHLDGVRFDASQDIHDSSAKHILAELAATIRRTAGNRQSYVIVENEPQDVRNVRAVDDGGLGLDAIWNDDFHHSAMVRLTGHNEAYYSDYLGGAEELLAAVKRGFIYQGQRSQWQEHPRGTPTMGLPATSFVTYLQNHDQVANSGLGERIDRLSSPGRVRAMTALWLLAPQTPLFFQGQEFAASAPFLYFADWQGEQAQNVTAGRIKFLSQFPSLATPEASRNIPRPTERATFERCKLDFAERESHRPMYAFHIDLLRLRREDPIFCRQDANQIDGATLGLDCLLIRYFSGDGRDRLLLVNFDRDLKICPAPQPLLAPPAQHSWQMLWSSDEPKYGGMGTPPLEAEDAWHIPAESAVVLHAVPANHLS
jgi:maltooligosyltrehalose trehalohydrolase